MIAKFQLSKMESEKNGKRILNQWNKDMEQNQSLLSLDNQNKNDKNHKSCILDNHLFIFEK